MVERGEREERTQPGLGCGGREVGLQHLEPADHLEQAAGDEQVDERQHRQRDEVVRQHEVPGLAAAEQEAVTGPESGERIRGSLEGCEPPGRAHDPGEQGGRTCDEGASPGPQHDHRGEVDARRHAKDARADRLAHAGAFGLFEQLGRKRTRSEQRESRQRLVSSRERAGHDDAEAGDDSRVREDG